ncbi:hypothetical protein [Vulcanisaeta distributa]|uniref:hypothetical protein n=1 Tax=Vulcanisaeta distributa TaxID=164451 RepID=UPI001FB4AB36|nr:hypothetical protein [Vulcanisaeta distributa]
MFLRLGVYRSGGYFVVAVPARLVEGGCEDIRAQVVDVLCRKYWRAGGDDGRRRDVVKALSRFAPAETIRACLGNAS